MASFKWVAFDASGARVTGVTEADNVQAVRNELTARRLTPSSIEESRAGQPKSLFSSRKPKVRPKDVALFTKQLSVVLKSGVPLADALRTIAESSDNETLSEALIDVLNSISTGMPIADALSRHAFFGPFLVEMVRAGEQTGRLAEVLARVSVQMDKSNKLRGQIKKALTYPTVILSFSVVAVVVMMVVVVPQFMSIMDGMDVEMPMLTQVVVSISDGLKDNIIIIVVVAAAAFYLFNRWKSTEAGAEQLDRFLLSLPIVGRIMSTSALANFASSLAFSRSAGLDMMESLSITSRVVGLRPMEKAVTRARGRIRDGVDLSMALSESREIFPALLTGMVRVGEESGELEDALGSVAEFYEQEVEDAAAGMSAMIEPFIMAFLAVFVGGLVAALMLPMVSVMQGI